MTQLNTNLGNSDPNPDRAIYAILYRIANNTTWPFINNFQKEILDRTKKTAIHCLKTLSAPQDNSPLKGKTFRIEGGADWLKLAGALSIYFKKQELLYPCQFIQSHNGHVVKVEELKSGKPDKEGRRDAHVVFQDNRGAYQDIHQFIAEFVSDPSTPDQYDLLTSVWFKKIGEKIKANPPNLSRKLFPVEPMISALNEVCSQVDINPHELDSILARAFLRRILNLDVLSGDDNKAKDLYNTDSCSYVDTLLFLMLAVEGSRNSFSFLSVLMLLDLVASQAISSDNGKPYSFRDFFANDSNAYWENIVKQEDDHRIAVQKNVSGMMPMSATATGPGNLSEANKELYPKDKDGNKIEFSPAKFSAKMFHDVQKLRVTAQEMRITLDWFKTKDPDLYEEIQHIGQPSLPFNLFNRIKGIFQSRLELAYSPAVVTPERIKNHVRFLVPNPEHIYTPTHSYSIASHALRSANPAHYYVETDKTKFRPLYFHNSLNKKPCRIFNENYPDEKRPLSLSVKSIEKRLSITGDAFNSQSGEVDYNVRKFAAGPKLPMSSLLTDQKSMLEQITLSDLEKEILKRLREKELRYFSERSKQEVISYLMKNRLGEDYTKFQFREMVNQIKVTLNPSKTADELFSSYSIDDTTPTFVALGDSLKLPLKELKALKEIVMKALLLAIDQQNSYLKLDSSVEINEMLSSDWRRQTLVEFIRPFDLMRQFSNTQILTALKILNTYRNDEQVSSDEAQELSTLIDSIQSSEEKFVFLISLVNIGIRYSLTRRIGSEDSHAFATTEEDKREIMNTVLKENIDQQCVQQLIEKMILLYKPNWLNFATKSIESDKFTREQIGNMIDTLKVSRSENSETRLRTIDKTSQSYLFLCSLFTQDDLTELEQKVLLYAENYPRFFDNINDRNKYLEQVPYQNNIKLSVSPSFKAVIKAEDSQGISLDPCPECYRNSQHATRRQFSLSVLNLKTAAVDAKREWNKRRWSAAKPAFSSNSNAMSDSLENEEKKQNGDSLPQPKRLKENPQSNSNSSSSEMVDEPPSSSTLPITNIQNIPTTGIQIGLKNLGNTCWLNAALQFISCHKLFDQMLFTQIPQDRKKIQALLRRIVANLRSNRSCDPLLLKQFGQEMNKFWTALEWTEKQQHDSPEFLTLLTELLRWNPTEKLNGEEMARLNDSRQYPRQLMTYESIATSNLPQGCGKRPFHENSQAYINISLPESDTPVDLSVLFEEPEECDVLPDIFPASTALSNSPSSQNFSFRKTKRFTCLPNSFLVYLERFKLDSNQERQKISTPIKVDQTIDLWEYRNEGELWVKDRLRSYKIGAAITHIGDSFKSGHFITHERAADGSLLAHNDELVVTGIPEMEFGAHGYLIRLDALPANRTAEEQIFNLD